MQVMGGAAYNLIESMPSDELILKLTLDITGLDAEEDISPFAQGCSANNSRCIGQY